MTFNNEPNFFSTALEATIEEPVCPKSRGKIKCHGIFYRAELYGTSRHHLLTGQRVYMIGIRDNIALIVV